MKYALVFLLLAAAAGWTAFTSPPGGWVLLPVAIAFGGTSLAYCGAGSRVLGKRPEGSLAPWAWVVYWPALLLNWALLRAYGGRGERAFTLIAPGVYLGRIPLLGDQAALEERGIRSVLDLTAEFPTLPTVRRSRYVNTPLLDGHAPTPEMLGEAVAWIRARPKDTAVLIHCAVGYQRSATVAAAYLLAAGLAESAEAAEATLQTLRPGVRLTAGQREALAAFAAGLSTRAAP
jgi:rhodanese-related sulfurtransferase